MMSRQPLQQKQEVREPKEFSARAEAETSRKEELQEEPQEE